MNGSSDRRVDRLFNSLADEIERDRKTIEALRLEIQRLRFAQKEMGKKLDRLVAQADEKREVQRVEAITDVVKNDKAFKTIAIVTSGLTFVAIIFAVLLALFWKK